MRSLLNNSIYPILKSAYRRRKWPRNRHRTKCILMSSLDSTTTINIPSLVRPFGFLLPLGLDCTKAICHLSILLCCRRSDPSTVLVPRFNCVFWRRSAVKNLVATHKSMSVIVTTIQREKSGHFVAIGNACRGCIIGIWRLISIITSRRFWTVTD